MRRFARALAAVVAAFLVATPAPRPPSPGPGERTIARLHAEPVALNPGATGERILGPLRYLDGWTLSSDDRRFGAVSSLAVSGDRLLALSDQGMLLRFDASPGETVEIIPLSEGPGSQASKVDRDSESLALAGDRIWIAYENSNEIWRYDLERWTASSHAAPAAMKRWSPNRGAETLVRLTDGRFLAIREDVDKAGVSDALLFAGDPAEASTGTAPLKVDPPEGYRITDGASLPDGRLLLVARAFGGWSGWTARLLLAELPACDGQLMPVREIAALASPLTRDNMEAIAVAQEDGRTIIWLASDDNLNPLQRTLLLKFEWIG